MEGVKRAARAAGIFLFVFFYNLTATYAATEHLPPGFISIKADVNGDRRSDVILQPRTPENDAAVLLGVGEGTPEIFWQRLTNIDPELVWDEPRAAVTVADFNGDERDDIYVQGRAPGSVQALLMASDDGTFTAAAQKFAGEYMGFDWAAEQRTAIAGDFDGNGFGELLMQGRHADDIHIIVRPDAHGTLNTTGPSWIDGHLDLRWNASNIELHAGDFNGDGRTDALWRRNARSPAKGGEPQVALLLADSDGAFPDIAQAWEKDFLGAEWDPATHDIRIADINRDGIADIVLYARAANGTHYLVPGRMDGQFTEVALRWQGDQTAEDAWAASNAGVADVVISAAQTRTVHAAEETAHKGDAVMQASGGFGPPAVGTLPGEFSVDPTGASNYRIPIAVPPGVAGMQPDLAFMYSSRAGNGLLGVGWSLSGLSAITRCPQSTAQAGSFKPVTYRNTDAFCLDGQLLRLVNSAQTYGASGAVYGTEISSFQRVESRNGSNSADPALYTGPQHFIVKDQAGLIREYGNTSNSRIPVAGKIVTKQWALNRISDRFGNYIRFEYEQGVQGSMHAYWPQSITWHNNNDVLIGKVELEYEDRPDTLAGSEPFALDETVYGNSLFKRLTHVKVFARNTAVRDYHVEYMQLEPSDLSAIRTLQLCDGFGSCLAPTTFTWSSGEKGLKALSAAWTPPGVEPAEFPHKRVGDANGDGRQDIFHFSDGNLHWYDAALNQSVDTGVDLDGYHRAQAVVLDYNRDGRSDVLIANAFSIPNPVKYWHIAESQPDGGYLLRNTNALALGYDNSVVPLDIENDGYPELFFIDGGKLKFYRNSATGFNVTPVEVSGYSFTGSQQIIPIEYNGDGLADIFMTRDPNGQQSARIFTSNGTTLQASVQNLQAVNVVPLDWNGDGLTDLVVEGHPYLADTVTDRWYKYRNAGGWFEYGGGLVGEDSYHQARVIDWDRDGIAELIYPDSQWTNKWKTWSGDTTSIPADVTEIIPLDYDGNGVTDALYKDGDWKRHIGAGEAPGLLVHVENGLGDEQEVRYWHLNRVPHWNADVEDVYLGHDPDLDYFTADAGVQIGGTAHYFLASIPVVAAIEADTGVKSGGQEGRIVTSYRYAGAVMDVEGRGFLGFRMMKVQNANTGIETVNLHRQAFPFTGMIEKAVQKIPDVTLTTVTEVGGGSSCVDFDSDPLEPRTCGYDIREESTVEGITVSESTSMLAALESGVVDGGVFPYVATTTEKQYRFPWDGVGALPLVRVQKTTYTYGATASSKITGDPTRIEVLTSTNGGQDDLHTVVTNNTYAQNDVTTHWCLGRLTASTVTHTRPPDYLPGENLAPTSEERQATFGYDQTVRALGVKSCRLNHEVADVGTDFEITKDYRFDAFGNTDQTTVSATGETSRVTAQTYDYRGLFPRVTENVLDHQEFYVWDNRFGVKRSSTGPNGLTTVWDYDSFGRLVKETAPRTAVTTSHAYQWCGAGSGCKSASAVYYTRVESSVGSNAYAITEYDALGREVASRTPNINGQEIVTQTVFDSLGRPYLTSLPYVNGAAPCWNHTVFDLLGRPEIVSAPPGDSYCSATGAIIPESQRTPAYLSKFVQYVYAGLTTTATDQDQRIKITVSNVLGRVRTVTENDGTQNISTSFDYDALGNTTTVKPPDGGVVRIGYDAAGRKTSMNDPDMGNWTYDYTGFGELEWQQDAAGNRVEMVYDKLGRMRARDDIPAGGTAQRTTWTYDVAYGAGTGKLAVVTGPDGYAESYAYNEYGQLTDTVRLADGKTFWTSQSYDLKGRPDVLVYPDVDTFGSATAPNVSNLAIGASVNGRHAVSWDSDSAHAQYTVYRTKDSTVFDPEGIVYAGPLPRFDDQVTEDATYRYWVKGCHAANCSATIGPVAVTIVLPPAAPAWLDVEDYDANFDGSIALSWGASTGAAEYKVQWDSDFDGGYANEQTVLGTATNVGGLTEGTWYFRVMACNVNGCGSSTPGLNPAIVITEPPMPGAPGINPDVTINGATTLSWSPTADGNVNAYELDIAKQVANGPEVIETRMIGGSPQEVAGLANGTYRFRLRACKIVNTTLLCGLTGADSAELRAGTRPAQLPPLNTPTNDADGAFAITFDGTNPNHADSITLQEATDAGFTNILRSDVPVEDLCYTEPDEGQGHPPIITCIPPQNIVINTPNNGPLWYRIQACNGIFGCGAWRETAHATYVSKPPGVPGALTVPATSSSRDYTITWGASSGVVTHYELYEDSNYADEVLLNPGPGSATSHVFTGRPDGWYTYRVRACYLTTCSGYRQGGNVLQLVGPPPAPSVTATAVNAENRITVDWSDSAGAQRYQVVYADNAAFSNAGIANILGVCSGSECQEIIVDSHWYHEGPADGTWHYKVSACNDPGCEQSTAVSATLSATPSAPTGVSAAADTDNDGTFTVSWNAMSGVTFKVYERTNGAWNATPVATVASSSYSPNRNDGTYAYRIKACRTTKCSGDSATTSDIAITNVPGVPASISYASQDTNGAYTVSWGASAASGAASIKYHLQQSKNSSTVWTNVGSLTASTSMALSGLGTGNYKYRIRACNGGATSVCSGFRTTTTTMEVRIPPSTPSSISAPTSVPQGQQYSVSWGASSGTVTRYELRKSSGTLPSGVYYSTTARTKNGEVAGNVGGEVYYWVKACNDWACSGNRGPDSTLFAYPAGGCTPTPTDPCTDPQFTDPGETMLIEEDAPADGSAFAPSPSKGEGEESVVASTSVVTVASSDAGTGPTAVVSVNVADDLLAAKVTEAATVVETVAGTADHNVSGATSKPRTRLSHPADHGFRATPPVRPAAFHRSLRVGHADHASRQDAGTAHTMKASLTRTRSPYSGNSADNREPTRAEKAASQLTFDDAGHITAAPVEPVAPLRRDSRIQPRQENTATNKTATGGTGVSVLKFGETNEPTGTYAHAVQHVYHSGTGALIKVRECVANAADTGCDSTKGQTYWEAKAVNAAGAVVLSAYGNGLSTYHEFDMATGTLRKIETGASDASGGIATVDVQMLTYTWDMAGNLTQRHDHLINGGQGGGFVEDFQYDGLSRLKSAKTNFNIVGVNDDTRHNHYQKNGNLSCFNTTSTGCTTADYSYHTGKLHAVAQKGGSGPGAGSYTYNLNGSMLTGPDREISWTAFNKPELICKGAINDITGECGTATWSQFKYDPNRARYAQVTVPATTYYIGSLYERVVETDTNGDPTGNATHRFHIFAGGGAVAVYSCTTSCGSDPEGNVADGTKDETLYLHRDHLGSITAITDGTPIVNDQLEIKEQFSYSAWGGQQKWNPAAGIAGEFEAASSTTQTRGYTGHEMLSELGLVNMNGRIYDQHIGRFISADPFVQFPQSTQGYNRYTYVGNNPLSYTDPSGYFSLKKELGNALGHVAGYLSFIPGCQLWCSALAGAVSGYLLTGSLKGAVLGGLSGLASGTMAQWADTKAFGSGFTGYLKGAATAGAIAGGLSAAGGGRFGDGFLSGFAGGTAGALSGGNPIAAAILGGTVSKIGGGRFASGAKSGFFHALIGPSLVKGLKNFGSNPAQQATPPVNRNGALNVDSAKVRATVQEQLPKVRDALARMAADQGTDGWSADDLYKLKYEVQSGFAPGQDASSTRLTRAEFADSILGVKDTVRIYGDAVAMTGASGYEVAETLSHEFRHSTEANMRIVDYSVSYENQPHEVDARRFAKDAMKYYGN